jgi:SAM-dependent methyltransferase
VRSTDRFWSEFWPRVAVGVTGSRIGNAEDLRPLLRRLRIRSGARVLDVPCGFGRHAVALARQGCRVTGVDISAHLLRQARVAADAAGVVVDWRRGDMRRLRFRGQFDLALNLFTSFGYFGDAEDARVLRGLHRALRPGGWLVLQVINRDFIVRHYHPRRSSRLADGTRLREVSMFDPATSTGRTQWTARRGAQTWRGTTRMRFYSPHELRALLAAAGFVRIVSSSTFAGAPLTFHQRWQAHLGQRPPA